MEGLVKLVITSYRNVWRKVLEDKRGSFIVVLKRLPKIVKNLLLPA